jgi:hypothetical protein
VINLPSFVPYGQYGFSAGTLKSTKLLAGSCTVHALCSATMREVLVGDITAPVTASGTLATGK